MPVDCTRSEFGGHPSDNSVDFQSLATELQQQGATGADIARVCQEAALAALRENIEEADTVTARHFGKALSKLRGDGGRK